MASPASAALGPTVTNTDTTVLLSPSVPPLAGQLGDVVPLSKQDEREFLLNSPFFNDCYLSDSVDSSVSDTEGPGAKFDRISSSTIVSRTVIRSPLHSRVVADVRPSAVGAPLALSSSPFGEAQFSACGAPPPNREWTPAAACHYRTQYIWPPTYRRPALPPHRPFKGGSISDVSRPSY